MSNRWSAESNIRWANRFVPQLRSAQFSMVAASGSTSYRSASRSKDLDLFCVATSGRLWSALTRGLIVARVFRKFHPGSPEICFSCAMDEEYAATLFKDQRGPLFARDALETVVLKGDQTYRSLLRDAEWISTLFPTAYAARLGLASEPPTRSGNPSTKSRIIEGFLFLIVGGYLGIKAEMLNRRFSKAGRLDNVFTFRCGRDHLIYESRRYSRLRQMYAKGISADRRTMEAE